MTVFKIKKKRNQTLRNKRKITLDEQHMKKMIFFKNQKKKLPELEKKYKRLNKRLNKLDKTKNLKKYKKCCLDLKEVTEMIKKISDNNEEIDYLLNTSHLLFNYYENKNSDNYNYENPINNNTILQFFKNEKSVEKNNKGFSKKQIIDKYLNNVDPNYIKSLIENNNYMECKYCNIEKIVYQTKGIIICPKCGEQQKFIVSSDKPSYKEPPKEISCYSYKRINHFNEWLAQFQAKESTDIPQIVYDKILIEIKKERLTNIAELKPLKLREILKKLLLNKYYEHVPHIINRLNGIQAPTMTRDIEEKLRAMFKEIQIPFMKHCPKNRKNFLSYSYVLHKFVQLLELDSFLPSFPLLKSREKLHQQDKIWSKICQDLNWEFIKSL